MTRHSRASILSQAGKTWKDRAMREQRKAKSSYPVSLLGFSWLLNGGTWVPSSFPLNKGSELTSAVTSFKAVALWTGLGFRTPRSMGPRPVPNVTPGTRGAGGLAWLELSQT